MALKRNILLLTLAISLGYGVISYWFFFRTNGMATLSFLGLVPLALGAVPLLLSDEEQIRSYVYVLCLPWLGILLLFAVLFACFGEGVLCLAVLGLPIYGVAMLGTLIACLVRASRIKKRKRQAAAATLLLLPFLLVGAEQRYLVREEQVSVCSTRVMTADAAQVFEQLAAFETIRDAEYRPGVLHLLGVPRPIRATVDKRAVGGHRLGVFEDGLRFRESITAYDAPRRMTFDIHVDPAALRPGSTEKHAFESGYFRFVDASYSLVPLGHGKLRLELASTYVAQSSVNAYGKLWANAIVRDFQDRVLEVLANRCDRRARHESTELARLP